MKKKQPKKSSIRDRLNSIVKDIKVDLFGYEKTVSDNINNYFIALSKKYNIEQNLLDVRIGKQQALSIQLFYEGQFLQKISTDELISFFMGEGANGLVTKHKIELDVSNYLSTYATTNTLNVNRLTIRLSQPVNELMIIAYEGETAKGTLELKELIKHFKS